MSSSLRHPPPDLPLRLDRQARPVVQAILDAGDTDALLAWQQRHGALRTLEPSEGWAWAHVAWKKGHRELGDMLVAAGCRTRDPNGSVLDWLLAKVMSLDQNQAAAWLKLFSTLQHRPGIPRLNNWSCLGALALNHPSEQEEVPDSLRLALHRMDGQPTPEEAQAVWNGWNRALRTHPAFLHNPWATEKYAAPTLSSLVTQALWRRVFRACPYDDLVLFEPLPSKSRAPAGEHRPPLPGLNSIDTLFRRLDLEGHVAREAAALREAVPPCESTQTLRKRL